MAHVMSKGRSHRNNSPALSPLLGARLPVKYLRYRFRGSGLRVQGKVQGLGCMVRFGECKSGFPETVLSSILV